MNITVDITADLESRLLQKEAKQGIDPGQFIVHAVRARLQGQDGTAPCLDAEQSRLLEDINRGLSQTQWSRYYALVAKRQTDALTEDEYAELTATSNRIEELNAHRMERLGGGGPLSGPTLLGIVLSICVV